jgi:hypothetical protein
MKYAYEDLGDDQFEHLIVLLCQRLLGDDSKASAFIHTIPTNAFGMSVHTNSRLSVSSTR